MNTVSKQRQTSLLSKIAALAAAAATMLAGAAFASSAIADDEITNLALKGTDNEPNVTASYTGATWSPLSSINNGVKDGSDSYGGFGTYGSGSTQDWAQYEWNKSITTSKSVAYFWTNVPPAQANGDSGVILPSDVTLQYYNAESNAFENVKNQRIDKSIPTNDELVSGQTTYGPFTFTFDEVTTTALRLGMTKSNASKGITVSEWEVYGTVTPAPIDPGEPNTFLWTQEIDVRTTPGADPTSKLPNSIWATPENGPTKKLQVKWNPINAADYASEGTFTVQGVTTATDSIPATNVEATVQVVSTLSDDVTDAEYVSTVTQAKVKPSFPDTVYLEYADGTKESGHSVTWEEPAASDYDEVDDFGTVNGSVNGTDVKAQATWFVVEPTSNSAPPVVSLSFNTEAQNGTGYFTSTPKFTITAQRGVANVAISKLEYRLNGGEWQEYNGPTKVTEQGTIKVEARATDAKGRTATQTQTIKVDTNKPVTKATSVVKGRIATVTITPDDGANGSGVTRTVYSNGPDSNPSSNSNTMWATYNPGEPVKIELSSTADTWIHYYSQDAAGNEQARQSLNLGKAQNLPVESITISGDGVKDGKLTLEKGVTAALNAKVTPEEATNPQVTWTSSDESVATVNESGSVTTHKKGTATITATADGKSASITLAVTDPQEATAESKDNLAKQIEAAEKKLSTGDFTDDSVKVVKDAIAAAKKLVSNDNALQKDVDSASSTLSEAVKNLVDKPSPDKPDNPDNPNTNNPDKPNNPNQQNPNNSNNSGNASKPSNMPATGSTVTLAWALAIILFGGGITTSVWRKRHAK